MASTPATTAERFLVQHLSDTMTGEYDLVENQLRLTWTGQQVFLTQEECAELLCLLTNIPSIWRDGYIHGGGQPTSEWSPEKLEAARQFIAAHQQQGE